MMQPYGLLPVVSVCDNMSGGGDDPQGRSRTARDEEARARAARGRNAEDMWMYLRDHFMPFWNWHGESPFEASPACIYRSDDAVASA